MRNNIDYFHLNSETYKYFVWARVQMARYVCVSTMRSGFEYLLGRFLMELTSLCYLSRQV